MKSNFVTLAAITITILATGCNQSSQSDNNSTPANANSLSVTQQLQDVKEVATNAWQKVKDTTTNAWADIKETMQPAVDYTYDQKDTFVANAQADVAALDEKINELSDKIIAAGASVQNEGQTKLQGLRGKSAELHKKLDAVKNASQADWDELKAGFKSSYDDAKASLKQAWQWLNDKLNS